MPTIIMLRVGPVSGILVVTDELKILRIGKMM